MAIFGPKPLVNPLGKMSILRHFKLFVVIAWQGFFFVLEYHKKFFAGLNCLKKKVRERAIFGAKPWVKPSGKVSIFRLFEFVVFIAYKGVFSVVEYHKRQFPGLN